MTTPLATSAGSKLRRHLAGLCVTLGIAAGIVAATSTSAHAASAVVGCFVPAVTSTPSPSLAGAPVQIHYRYNGTWYYATTVYLGANHCAGWNVPAYLQGQELIMMMDYSFGDASYRARWIGLSPIAPAGTRPEFVGANYAFCVTGCFMY